MTDVTLNDLVEEAGDTAEEAQAPGKSTGEWVSETVELLDKRGLLEPILFGPEGAKELEEQAAQQVEQAQQSDGDDDGLDLDAETLADAGEAIMDQLGEDVTVAEVVQICRDNPSLVNSKISEALDA